MFEIDGERILVTGASSGLGAHFARMLAARGARVAAAARRRDRLEALASATGGAVVPVPFDASDPEAVRAGVASAAEALGGLDGAVLNAGVARSGRALDMDDADWRAVMDVNLDGVFRCAQAAARAMPEGGSIVVISSILAFGTGRGVAAYAVSKAGASHLVRCFAAEWGRKGIRVNALAPGYVPTEINADFLNGPEGEKIAARTPLGRLGRPDDLDGALLLLLSDAGRYVTGATIPVDGGHLVAPL